MDGEVPGAAGSALKTTTTLARPSAGTGPPVLDEPSVLRRGDSLGRYMVLEPLGTGGMGVVYAAYDPDLDRKIAVKLLRSDLFARPAAREARRRLRREAQALARLNHSNIVTVYDAGTVGDQLFVAMEYVEGRTLRQWATASRSSGTPRPWRRVLEVFTQAGRGLAAAHAAGVVHRDFKPGNVMIGDDGRVRVLDFGLATSSAALADEDRDPGDESASAAAGASAGSRDEESSPAGTPAYMAPEQAAGGQADARSDQFSFCCALYEALYGVLPFDGDTEHDYLAAARSGTVREPPAGAPVPSWIWRTLARGLAASPEQRHASMDALVALLERDPGAGRRRLLLAAAALAVIAAAVAGWRLQESPSQLCRGAEARLAGIWDQQRRAAMGETFAATGAGYASESARETARLLDAYTGDWVAMRTEACEATHLRGEQSPRLLDLRMSCLDDRLRELGALTDLFLAADDTVVEKAVAAAGRLRRLEACADADLLTAVLPLPDAETRDQVTRIRHQLASVQALHAAGKYQQGLEEARRVDADARQASFAPLIAETRHRLAELLRERDAYDEAESALVEALHFAERGWHERIRVETLLSLVFLANSRAAFDDGRRWLRVAAGAVHRLEEPGELMLRWHHAAALIEIGAGNYLAAVASARSALEGGEALYGREHPNIGGYLSTLTLALRRHGRDVEALPYLERLAAIRWRALGGSHPYSGAADHALGTALYRLGRLEEAELALRRALATCVSGFGPRSSAVAIVRSDLGALLLDLGRSEEALHEFQQALDVRRATYGEEHQAVAKSLSLLGKAEAHLGRFDEAERTLSEALRMKRATAGARRSVIAFTLVHLGDLRIRQQRHVEALEAFREARAIVGETLGPEHRLVGHVACGLGEAEIGRGRHERAVSELETALASPGFRDPVLRARCSFSLARALWRQGSDRARALDLARTAGAGYAALGRSGQPVHREVTAWLEARRRQSDPRSEAGR